jgi:hypothetical protein
MMDESRWEAATPHRITVTYFFFAFFLVAFFFAIRRSPPFRCDLDTGPGGSHPRAARTGVDQ